MMYIYVGCFSSVCEEQSEARVGQLHHVYSGPGSHLQHVSRGILTGNEDYRLQRYCQRSPYGRQGR